MRGTFGVMLILEPGTITVARSEQEQNALFATGTVSNDANTAYMTAGSELIREFRDPETTDERREAIEEEYEELGSQALEQNRNNYFSRSRPTDFRARRFWTRSPSSLRSCSRPGK